MEFNNKLQQLRKQNGLTQEQLAEQLFVSRTAVSKWESGKGYPNIETLKSLAKLYSVSIDELLSSEELMSMACLENRSNMCKLFHMMYGGLDLLILSFVFLPFYSQAESGHIRAVNLLEYTETTSTILISYWVLILSIAAFGIAQLVLTYFEKDVYRNLVNKWSFLWEGIAITLFSAAREPYVTASLFLIFCIKIFLLLKERQIK